MRRKIRIAVAARPPAIPPTTAPVLIAPEAVAAAVEDALTVDVDPLLIDVGVTER